MSLGAMILLALFGWQMGRETPPQNPALEVASKSDRRGEDHDTSPLAPQGETAWRSQFVKFEENPGGAIAWMGEMVAQLDGDELFQFLMQALDSSAVETRMEALLHSTLLEREQTKSILLKALMDEDPRVRDRCLNKIHEKPDSYRIEILEVAAAMPQEDIVKQSSEWLAVTPSEEGTKALVAAYHRQKNPKLAALIRKALFQLTGEDFVSPSHAAKWLTDQNR